LKTPDYYYKSVENKWEIPKRKEIYSESE